MATACIVMSDVSDTENAMSVVFDGGFDHTSPAHCAIKRVLAMVDQLGLDVVEPIEPVAEPSLIIGG